MTTLKRKMPTGFSTLGKPEMAGRVIQRQRVEELVPEAKSLSEDKLLIGSLHEVVQSLKNKILTELLEESSVELEDTGKLPWTDAKSLVYLKNVETYLLSQLQKVRESIQELQQKALE